MQGLAEHFWAWVFALNELGLDGQIRSKEWHDVIYTIKGSLWLPAGFKTDCKQGDLLRSC